MTEVMVTMKFKESEINVLYYSLLYHIENRRDLETLLGDKKELYELSDALKKIRQRIQDEKEKAKQEHKEG